MNRRQKIIVSITGIFIVLLILVGLTYAYFLTRINGNTNTKSISATTANLALTYGDGNGEIGQQKIKPGTVIGTKEFTVENTGNATTEYGVFLENVINQFVRTQDLVIAMTCTSSAQNKTCNGYNNAMPYQNDLLTTNSIDVSEVQTYQLTLEYVEAGVDQSDDMNKELSAKVQIYDLNNTVDLAGIITDYNKGDYVVVHSDPKESQIRSDGSYKVVGLTPDDHTVTVYNSNDTVKYTKSLTITKGDTESTSGTNITVADYTRTVITSVSSNGIDVDSLEINSPFKSGTLANAIYTNAVKGTNGTIFRTVPLTKPAEEPSSFIYLKGDDPTTFTSTIYSATTYYISYADDYEINETTGKYTLVNPVVATTKYTADMASALVGKYAVWQTSAPTISNTQNQSTIYKISTNVSDITSTIKYESIFSSTSKAKGTESELSVTQDDLGTSYYYRGGVEDNYVDFAGMCWRIVRIEGDGSVKLILEDQDSTCANSDGNWNIPTTTGGSTKTGNFGYDITTDGRKYIESYLNPKTYADNSMVTAFKNFQTGPLSSYLSKLRPGNWCYNDKAYTSETGETLITDRSTYYTNKTSFYYDSYVRLVGKTPKEPTLKCNGTVMNKFGDNTTDMYVATLTADEIMYAGEKYGTINKGYYLKNGQSLSFWSLSPSCFSRSSSAIGIYSDSAFDVYTDGGVSSSNVDDFSDNHGFRPAVSLKSSTEILSGGNGTKSAPYVIS